MAIASSTRAWRGPGARRTRGAGLVVTLAVIVGACDRDEAPTAAAAPARETPASPGAGEGPPSFRARRSLMGTVFSITVAGADARRAGPAVDRAFDEIARLETLLSEWQDDTEVSRINAGAGGAPVPVSEEVLRVVEAGVDVSRRSGGAFDLSWAALHGLYRFPPNPIRLPDDAELAARLPLIDWTDIEVSRSPRTVRLAREGMAIGTGGIAKGYALDRAAAILTEAGFTSFMLFGGGQVQVRGTKPDGSAWRVGIQHPRRPSEYFGFLESDGGSISTSGDYEHFHVDDAGRRWHHLIDPRTGRPARRLVSVTMLAPSGLYADALSTACFILGRDACFEMLAAHPDAPQAVVVDRELRVHATPAAKEALVLTTPLDDGRLPR